MITLYVWRYTAVFFEWLSGVIGLPDAPDFAVQAVNYLMSAIGQGVSFVSMLFPSQTTWEITVGLAIDSVSARYTYRLVNKIIDLRAKIK